MTRMIPLCVTLLAHSMFAAVNYSYDDAGRLSRVDYGPNGSIDYSYDKSGNLVSKVMHGPESAPSVITSVSTMGGGAEIAQNSWIEIRGSHLVPIGTSASGVSWSGSGELPSRLRGVSVTVNGKPAPVSFYCSGIVRGSICALDEIRVLTPLDDAVGPVQVIVKNGSLTSAPFTVAKNAVAPALLHARAGYVAVHSSGAAGDASAAQRSSAGPVKPGEAVVIYGTGFGMVATLPACIVGGHPAKVDSAALISPGVARIRLTVPAKVTAGDNDVRCTVGGVSTPDGSRIRVSE
ncbi:MAG: hypothetical protein U0Q16_19360 [Bryobacteraceae bacterium]